MTALAWIVETRRDATTFVLRVMLGLVMFPHGAQKILGWFGGPGLGGHLQAFQDVFGIPPVISALVAIGEFFGALALLAGLLTRVSAASIGVIMMGAVLMAHVQHGFFMNWMGTQAGEGFEYHLLAIGMALALVIHGGGAWSIDERLARSHDIAGARA